MNEVDMGDDFDILRYFLTSSIRLKILLELQKSNKVVKDLKKVLDKSESNILHYMNDLEDIEIIEKVKDEYTLSSKGYLIIRHLNKLYDNWNSIENHLDFLDEHVEPNLPLDFILNMDLWDEAELIYSSHIEYDRAIRIYKDLVYKSRNLKVILPIFSRIHLNAIFNSLKENNGTLDLITSKFMIRLILDSDLSDIFTQLKKNSQINIIYTSSHNSLNKFLTSSEIFASLFLFYENRNCDDSEMLLLQNPEKLRKLNNLIDENKLYF